MVPMCFLPKISQPSPGSTPPPPAVCSAGPSAPSFTPAGPGLRGTSSEAVLTPNQRIGRKSARTALVSQACAHRRVCFVFPFGGNQPKVFLVVEKDKRGKCQDCAYGRCQATQVGLVRTEAPFPAINVRWSPEAHGSMLGLCVFPQRHLSSAIGEPAITVGDGVSAWFTPACATSRVKIVCDIRK